MRKFTFLLMLLSISAGLAAQTFNVTFKVNMNDVAGPFTTPEVNGSFNGWCGGCAPMSDPDLDGIWEVTIALAAGTYEYKFAYDSWAGQENLLPGSPCTVTNFGFTNRALEVSADAVLDVVCWGSCVDCAAITTYDVTFSVNMNDVPAGFTTPEVNGTFNGWCGGCNPLSDPDGDGIWETTIALLPGTYQYKFAYDAWAGSETLIDGAGCTINDGGFINRIITIGADTDIPTVCWGSCFDCGVVTSFDITFQVNMNEVAEPFTTPEVNGNFNGWCGGCNPLSDVDGDGIWSTTITLEAGNYEYKFAYDAWTGQETLTEGSPCTVTNFGFTNRALTVASDEVLNPVCWGVCTGCTTTYYADADGDTYGNAASFISSTDFTAPSGYSINSTDCNDAAASVNPGATEICNTVDDNCDGLVDNGVINTTITASGPTTFCAGSNVILSVASGYTSYQWKKNGSNIAGANTASYTASITGNYSVVISSGTCIVLSAATPVTVSKPKPKVGIVGSLDICATGSVLLKGKISVGSTYAWYQNGILIVGAPLNLVVTEIGSYKFKETTALGCTKSVTTVVTSSCKIGDAAAIITLYPNPANESVTINFNTNSNQIGNATIALYSATGEMVYSESVALNNGLINTTIKLNNGIAAGMYLVKVSNGNDTFVKTLMVE